MNQERISKIVDEVMKQMSYIPIAVSARHAHLSSNDVEALFGEGYQLTKKADLSQPGQFSAKETITIIGPKGTIENVRVLGPARELTQIEISMTDVVKLGVDPHVRVSGDITGTSPIRILGPKGVLDKQEGVIIAANHIHMNEQDAKQFSVENGEYVRIIAMGQRPITFEKVLIRVSSRFKLEMHIDTDEANAGLISTGKRGILSKYGG
ncbi:MULTISPECIES: phosphate propanoyltransferase [Bacillus]|uniref:phosphate propanoyltransferase n=1 Tax=Bacillus TaxID=1386 RepID=UPI0002EA1E9E|nr:MULTISPECIES: phosphate propanoyltransferase [Bacillus]